MVMVIRRAVGRTLAMSARQTVDMSVKTTTSTTRMLTDQRLLRYQQYIIRIIIIIIISSSSSRLTPNLVSTYKRCAK